jgi:rare lipoprotein A
MTRRILLLLTVAALALVWVSPAQAYDTYASWYGPGFEGAETASGDIFEPYDFTVAHRTLPFGTRVRVCGPYACARAIVTDRGPYIYDREYDLSQGLAEYVGLAGVGWIDVEIKRYGDGAYGWERV